MGHAGAIVTGNEGTALSKYEALNDVGVATTDSPALIGKIMKDLLNR